MKKLLHTRGLSLVEVIVGSAILGAVFTSMVATYAIYVRASFQNAGVIKTAYLAEEGIEAVKTLRDKSWSANINPLIASTTYFLSFSGSTWLSTSTPEVIDSIYSRSFTLYNVYRDSNKDIISDSNTGTLDPDTKRVVVSVTLTPQATTSSSTGSASSPLLLSTTTTCILTADVVVSGTYAFVICRDRIQVYNVGDPSVPVLVSTKLNPENSTTPLQQYATISGQYLYVSVKNVNKFDVYDITDKSNLVRVGQTLTGSYPSGVAVYGTYVYLVNQTSNTLQVIQVSDPANPTTVATINTITNPRDVMVSGAYLYVFNGEGTNDGWLQVFSLATPSAPTLVGTTVANAFKNYPRTGYISNGLLYTGSYGISGLQVTNISNPNTPTVVSTLEYVVRNPPALAGRNGYLYVVFDSYVDPNARALQVWSLASTTLPVYVSSLAVPNADNIPNALFISGSYLYLVGGSDNSLPGSLKIYGIGSDTSGGVASTTKTLSTYITNIFKN